MCKWSLHDYTILLETFVSGCQMYGVTQALLMFGLVWELNLLWSFLYAISATGFTYFLIEGRHVGFYY